MSPDVADQIAEQERFFAPLVTEPDGVGFTRDELDGVPVEWTQAHEGPADPTAVVLYLHGGGYSGGLAAWARRATARLALGLGCRVVAPDYRLAPRFPFPAAHDDVLAVYRHLVGPGGYEAERWRWPVTSAGGALTVSLCADARDLGMPMPACGMLNSLWADIALNTPSLDDPVRNRHDIRRELVVQLAETLLSTGGVDPMDGRHSPVYRDLTGLPPAAGAGGGARRLPRRQRAAGRLGPVRGVDVTITEYPYAEHIWILNGPWRLDYPDGYPDDPGVGWVDVGSEAPEAVTATDEMIAFVRRHTGSG